MTLQEFFNQNKKVAIAFSGGVDSAYLLYEAKKNNAQVKAYFVKSEFQPEFELTDAKKVAAFTNSELKVISCSVLSENEICSNPDNRCYFCKKKIFSSILQVAKEDGFSVLLDGTNASDQIEERPGMKVLTEMKVLSPLRLCNLTKEQIRQRSKEAGLFTWNKDSYSCLATRIPTNTKITKEDLFRIEKGEGELFNLGFTDFRIRLFHNAARIQLKEIQFEKAMKMKNTIFEKLSAFFDGVFLDLQSR